LQELHRSETLDELFTRAFCHPLARQGLKYIRLHMANCQFQQCAETVAALKLMTSEHRKALLSSGKLLMHKLIVSDDLLNKLPLCRERRKAIESAAMHEDKVNTLLDIVSRQPDSAFTQLLNALNDTQQTQCALIICPSFLSPREEKATPKQPEAALKSAEDSMRHLISKLPSVDDETVTIINNLQTSLSTLMCNTTVKKTHEGETNMMEHTNTYQDYKPLPTSEVTSNGRITAMQPMPVKIPSSTHTASKENRLTAIENRKLSKR